MSRRKQLLDPIGTMCKLVGLNFSEKNTKISIHDHILTLQRPHQYQFLVRIYNGDGRENISELYYAIIRLIQWYLIPQMDRKPRTSSAQMSLESAHSSEDDELEGSVKFVEIDNESNADEVAKSEELKKMVRYMCRSLRKLQETYLYGNVVLSLQFYINILEDGLEGVFDPNKLPTYLLKEDHSKENFLDYEKIKNLWDLERLRKVCELYDRCFESAKSFDSGPIIDGYLRSVDSILETTDQEFQELIRKSNEG